MSQHQSFDCVIVGGGVIGLSIAFELSNHPLSIAVVDRDALGQAASWAGAGILPPAVRETAVHPLDQLAAVSFETHQRWAATLQRESGIDTGYRRCGALCLARTPGELAALSGQITEWRDAGVACTRVSAAEIQQLVPPLTADPESILCAVDVPDESQIRNPDHLRALETVCRQRGVTLYPGVGELEIGFNQSRVTEVRGKQLRLTADRFCFAAGAWTGNLLRELGVSISVLPVRGQMVLYRLAAKPFDRIVYEGTKYLVPRDDGHVLVGSTMEEAGFDISTTDDGIQGLMQYAIGLVDRLQPDKVVKSWAGLRPATFDGFPYIGQLPSVENAWAACGHFRSGLLLSTGTALVIRDLMLEQQPVFDLSPFRLDRG